jgi:hypothetical protein
MAKMFEKVKIIELECKADDLLDNDAKIEED